MTTDEPIKAITSPFEHSTIASSHCRTVPRHRSVRFTIADGQTAVRKIRFNPLASTFSGFVLVRTHSNRQPAHSYTHEYLQSWMPVLLSSYPRRLSNVYIGQLSTLLPFTLFLMPRWDMHVAHVTVSVNIPIEIRVQVFVGDIAARRSHVDRHFF